MIIKYQKVIIRALSSSSLARPSRPYIHRKKSDYIYIIYNILYILYLARHRRGCCSLVRVVRLYIYIYIYIYNSLIVYVIYTQYYIYKLYLARHCRGGCSPVRAVRIGVSLACPIICIILYTCNFYYTYIHI